MTIAIVTDSTCDLPCEMIKENNITVVPMYVNIGAKSFRDGVDITRDEFYTNLPNYLHHPQTSTPSPQTFINTYQDLVKKGATEILSIHLSRSLSAVMDSAVQAAGEFTAVPVHVLDSHQLSLGLGFQVLTAAKAAASGLSLSEIITKIEEQISRTFSFAALSTMEFLKRSGRMSHAVYLMGNLMAITPIMHMYDGKPTSDRVFTRRRAIHRMRTYLERMPSIKIAALMHTHAYQEAQQLWEDVKDLLPDGPRMCVEINPVIGAHVGPGVIGFVCITETKPINLPW
jgi:DegV family protein with EDD domain